MANMIEQIKLLYKPVLFRCGNYSCMLNISVYGLEKTLNEDFSGENL